MMKRFATALVAALLASGAMGVATPALAQKKADKAAPAPKPPKLSKPVATALGAAQKAQTANDHATALAQVDIADAVPNKTAEEIYYINLIRLNSAQANNDKALSVKALSAMLETGMVPAENVAKFTRYIGQIALEQKDYAGATVQFEKLVQMDPADPDNYIGLAELYNSQRQTAKAIEMIDKAVVASKAKNAPAPEAWYRRALAFAYDGKLAPQTRTASLNLVRAYPNPVNWRDAIIILQDGYPNLDPQTQLDFLRLQAAVGGLNGERDFVEYADTALGRGFPGEAGWALKEGIDKKMLNPAKPLVAELQKIVNEKVPADKASLPGLEKEIKGNGKLAIATGDAYFGYGDFAKAAELYKIAIGNANADQPTANLRLGAALARTGDKAGAMAALQAVKGGAREALAQYWMAWLDGKA
jgi:tetratricopeptide (TPR) repeat protein